MGFILMEYAQCHIAIVFYVSLHTCTIWQRWYSVPWCRNFSYDRFKFTICLLDIILFHNLLYCNVKYDVILVEISYT